MSDVNCRYDCYDTWTGPRCDKICGDMIDENICLDDNNKPKECEDGYKLNDECVCIKTRFKTIVDFLKNINVSLNRWK